MSNGTGRVFVARLAGTAVFDPIGDRVGWARDVVTIIGAKGAPRAIGLVVEVPGKRRVFLPFTRVTSVDSGQILSTGLVNMRRFEQRPGETLVVNELIDRRITLAGGHEATILDVAIASPRAGEWRISQLYVRFGTPPRGLGSFRHRGETGLVEIAEAPDLARQVGVQSAAALLAAYEDTKPADLADLLQEMPPTRRQEVAAALDNARLADVIQELDDDTQIEVLSSLPRPRAADVLEEMDPDDAADLINELPDEQAEALLTLMEPDEAKDVRRLLVYDEHTAGGLMTTEPVIFSPETSIATALASVRRQDLTPALAAMVFVTRPPTETPTGHFLGVVHLQRLLREPPHTAVGQILDRDVEPLSPNDPLGRVTRLLATYNLTALPVVDSEQRLLGAVSADDVLDHLLPEDWRSGDDDVTDRSLGVPEHVVEDGEPGPAAPEESEATGATRRERKRFQIRTEAMNRKNSGERKTRR